MGIRQVIKGSDHLAIVSILGTLAWVLTYYWGGMTLFLMSYYFIIIPIIIAFAFSFFYTLRSFIRNGFSKNRIKVISHAIGITVFSLIVLTNIEILKSTRVLTATLYDDLFQYNLILRKNGNCELITSGMFGFGKTFNGNYYLKSDTIIFSKKPYSNDFIPDTLFLDRKENAIFVKDNKTKEFPKEKKYLNHFEVDFLSLN